MQHRPYLINNYIQATYIYVVSSQDFIFCTLCWRAWSKKQQHKVSIRHTIWWLCSMCYRLSQTHLTLQVLRKLASCINFIKNMQLAHVWTHSCKWSMFLLIRHCFARHHSQKLFVNLNTKLSAKNMVSCLSACF